MTAKPKVSEAHLATYVRDTAAALGWRRYHTWLSKHSAAGFPDEVLVRGKRLIFAELKGETGQTTPAQEDWLAALDGPPCTEVYLWRPEDMDRIERILR